MCKCNDEINAKLSEFNGRIALAIVFSEPSYSRPMVTVEKIKEGRGSKRPPVLMASFCPFCGVKYEVQAKPEN